MTPHTVQNDDRAGWSLGDQPARDTLVRLCPNRRKRKGIERNFGVVEAGRSVEFGRRRIGVASQSSSGSCCDSRPTTSRGCHRPTMETRPELVAGSSRAPKSQLFVAHAASRLRQRERTYVAASRATRQGLTTGRAMAD
ncbi:hypothetical protein [Burkholderia sp. ABCPW 14]|uniref:hypothetical protein n=1 Tax=Burkholderia sp. ABCPW 14 TaxID=1637860 RepID=UPI0012E377B8|nr:hypothetical protein [Burkholderia sp. ABCPW 14]